MPHRLTFRGLTVAQNALEPCDQALGKFNLIVSNPPYIPTGDIPGLDVSVKDYEPHEALDGGTDGLDFYRAIAVNFKDALTKNGMLAFECGMGQAPQDVYKRQPTPCGSCAGPALKTATPMGWRWRPSTPRRTDGISSGRRPGAAM